MNAFDYSCKRDHHAAHAHDHPATHPAKPVPKTPNPSPGAIYTCPMHPEVRQTGPGACPLCGMGLQLEAGSAAGDDGPNPELVDFTRRLWVATVLTVPLLVLTMSPYLGITAVRELFGEHESMWIELALSAPVILWSGWPFFERG
ncbi:MAG: heavy metal translocating P-type ATPase, partial [Candidatus Competibacteraceae bacterium]|nr:heavy metal translocating P-type ATPase [Candidatus Competibacteraceae bacterium]